MKEHLLNDQVAIVTGASRGIGRAVATTLAAQGVSVAISARSAEALHAVQQEIAANGGAAFPIVADLEDSNCGDTIVSQAIEQFGRLDILVNNAGIVHQGPILETSLEAWNRLMAVNARAPFLLCKAAVPHLQAAGGGTIIQIVSVIGVKGYVNQGVYTASKHALMGLSKVLAQEVQADNIRVHTILPGGVDTDMIADVRPDLSKDVLMQPQEIADIIMFLLTHRGNAVIDSVNIRRAVSSPWF